MTIKRRTIGKRLTFVYLDGDYVEFNEFLRPGVCPEQHWPTNSSFDNAHVAPASPHLPPAKRTTVRAQADERRKKKDDIANRALKIAETTTVKAMKYIRQELPYEFLQRSDRLVKSFDSFRSLEQASTHILLSVLYIVSFGRLIMSISRHKNWKNVTYIRNSYGICLSRSVHHSFVSLHTIYVT